MNTRAPGIALRTTFFLLAVPMLPAWHLSAMAAAPPLANVKDFGAVGDGKTDDTEAIRKTVQSLRDGGGIVYFPPGHYLSDVIVGNSGVTFKGDSGWGYRRDDNGATTISPVRDEMSCLFDLRGAVGTRLVGLTLDGKSKGREMHGVYASQQGKEQNIVIDDCKVSRFSGSGVRLEKVWVFAIRHSLIAHNTLSGIDGSGSYDGWILDNQITGNQRGGIYGTSLSTVTITANRIEWNRLGGIVLKSGNTVQICGCTFDRNFGPGIDISLDPRNGSSADVISGNIFRRNGYMRDSEPEASTHLCLRNVHGIAVTGNSMFGGPHPKDAQEDRPPSPLSGMLLDSLTESVVANNSLFGAARQTLILDKGGHRETVVRDNPGSLVELQAKK